MVITDILMLVVSVAFIAFVWVSLFRAGAHGG